MGIKVRFEAEIDEKLKAEMDSWGLEPAAVVKDAIEHSMWGAIKRKTDNLCRKCKKPIETSMPPAKRAYHTSGFCKCGQT